MLGALKDRPTGHPYRTLHPTRAARPALCGLLLCLTACGTMKAYEGEPLAPDETAIIKWSSMSGGAKVKSLNGELPGHATRAEILPGEHLVNFTHSPNLGLTTYSKTLSFEAEPGHTYKIRAKCGGFVECKPFWAWIEDLGDGSTVAGRRPE